jgi:site-specific DNA-methyltransferase (adenine-specific)
MSKSQQELITIKKAAELLGVSEQTLRRWDKSGKLQARRHPINGYRLYFKQTIMKLRREIFEHNGVEVET